MKPTTVDELFQSLPSKFDKEAADDIEAVYQFDLSGPHGGHYQVLIQDGTCVIREGRHPDPHVTLSMAAEDCMKVLNGQLSGPAIMMTGRLQISGDVGLAMQLKSLFPTIGS